MKDEKSNTRPEGIKRIYDAVSKLVKPPLAPLYQVFLDEQSLNQSKRNALLQKQAELRQEGFEAAVRLVISSTDKFQIERGSYFERIEQRGGKNDG